MKDDFPVFLFDTPAIAIRVDSRWALEDLLAMLMAKRRDRQRAVSLLSTALTYSDLVDKLGIITFGHFARRVEPPTLGEWLAEQGITIE